MDFNNHAYKRIPKAAYSRSECGTFTVWVWYIHSLNVILGEFKVWIWGIQGWIWLVVKFKAEFGKADCGFLSNSRLNLVNLRLNLLCFWNKFIQYFLSKMRLSSSSLFVVGGAKRNLGQRTGHLASASETSLNYSINSHRADGSFRFFCFGIIHSSTIAGVFLIISSCFHPAFFLFNVFLEQSKNRFVVYENVNV